MQAIHYSLSQMTDSELVRRFQNSHDVEAYSELYNRYYPKVELYCLKALSDLQNAKDAAQDVFLKVFEKLSTLQKPELWVAWLFTISRNVVLNIHRQHTRSQIEDTDEFPPIAEDSSALEDLREKERKLTALPKLLETPDARILKLKYVEGRSIDELTELMHLRKSAVKMRLLRARHHLVELYDQRYGSRA